MRAACCAVLLALPLAGGCEIFEETYTISSDTIFNQGGVEVTEYVEEDFGGSRWFQYRAFNNNGMPRCVRVSIAGGQTSGHSMGQVIRIDANSSADIGYVYLPADFTLQSQVWETRSDGTCGSPPG